MPDAHGFRLHRYRFDLFDWDEAKRERNLEKHRLDFARAPLVFSGTVIVRRSDRGDEPRWLAIGSIGADIVGVIFTIRPPVCRIISVRKARSHEREAYLHAVGGPGTRRQD